MAVLLLAKEVELVNSQKKLVNVEVVVTDGIVYIEQGTDTVVVPAHNVKSIKVGATVAQIAAGLSAPDKTYT
jgi:hypothetical protein